MLETDRKKLYSDASFDLEMSQLGSEQFPAENFDLVLQVIQDTRFLKSRNGWVLFSIFEGDWEKLSEPQKIRLFDTLSNVYELCEFWMACFTISEFAGEYFPAESSFQFFRQFANSQSKTARTFVPHGFEHAIMSSTSQELTVRIWDALLLLGQDQSRQVRGEVQESLSRLENQGFKRP